MMRNDGFTLVEMSVVLVIIGLLILTIFPALTSLRAGSQRSVTQNNLQALMLATASFVQANGCLPCPTPASTVGNGFGRVRGDTAVASCSGCTLAEGIPPFVSLGISPNVARDGWGHWFTMRVDPALTAAALGAVVPPTRQCTADEMTKLAACKSTSASQNGLCQNGLRTVVGAVPISVTMPGSSAQQVAVLFVSHGSKGYGALVADTLINSAGSNGCRLPFPNQAAICPPKTGTCAAPSTGLGYAQCNANGANSFYNPPPSGDYDDVIAYADRNMIVSMLGNGTACQTVW